jgi:hypothetical protein
MLRRLLCGGVAHRADGEKVSDYPAPPFPATPQVTPGCAVSTGCCDGGSPSISPRPVSRPASGSSTRATPFGVRRPTPATASTVCGLRRLRCSPRCPVAPRWSSASGAGDSCTSRWRWPSASATRWTHAVIFGCRSWKPLGSQCVSATDDGNVTVRSAPASPPGREPSRRRRAAAAVRGRGTSRSRSARPGPGTRPLADW